MKQLKTLAVVHPRTLEEKDLQAIAELRKAALEAVFKMCSGERSFLMSVPVQPDDTDIVLINALDGAERLIQEVYRIRGQIKVLLNEEYDMPDQYRNRLMAIIFDGTEDDPPSEENGAAL